MANQSAERSEQMAVSELHVRSAHERNIATIKKSMAELPTEFIPAAGLIAAMAIKAKCDRADLIRITSELLRERGITTICASLLLTVDGDPHCDPYSALSQIFP